MKLQIYWKLYEIKNLSHIHTYFIKYIHLLTIPTDAYGTYRQSPLQGQTCESLKYVYVFSESSHQNKISIFPYTKKNPNQK